MIYLRFVLPSRNLDSGVQDGIFEQAYALDRRGDLPEDEGKELQDLLRWMDDNLKVPTRFNRTKSKGYYRRKTKGISWLKSSASVHVAKMHRIVSILEERGSHVTMIKSSKPGYIVYQDDHQIVAEPFTDSIS